jgi:uncharacterized protein with HEPN domain
VKDDRIYLGHILRCIARIEDYASGGREAFIASQLVQDAVLRNLQTMAESTQRLSRTAKERRPDVDWVALGGLRNVLVHAYLGVDLELVQRALEQDLPLLKAACHAILEALGSAD